MRLVKELMEGYTLLQVSSVSIENKELNNSIGVIRTCNLSSNLWHCTSINYETNIFLELIFQLNQLVNKEISNFIGMIFCGPTLR